MFRSILDSCFIPGAGIFFINQIFNYEQYELIVSLGIIILYWVAYGFLLSEISKQIKPADVLEDTGNSGEQKLAPLIKIAIALGMEKDFENLFATPQFPSIEELIASEKVAPLFS